MYLSRLHRRMLMVGAMLGATGVAAVPMLAQNNVKLSPALAALLTTRKPNAKTSKAIDPNLSVSALQTRLNAVLAAKRKLHASASEAEREEQEREERERKTAQGKSITLKEMIERQKDEKDEDEWGVYEAARLHWLLPRAFPFDSINPQNQLNAMLRARQMPAASFAPRAAASAAGANSALSGILPSALPPGGIIPPAADPTWEFYGPPGYNNGQYSWRVGGAAYDPGSPNSTYYVAAPSGGIWKTVTAGQSWTPLTDNQIGLATSTVAVSPYNSQLVLAGTGDFDGGNGPGFGVLRSTNAGASWTVVGGAQFGTESIHRIVFDPYTPNRAFATGGNNGLFRTQDGGLTWTYVAGPTATATTAAIPGGRWSNIAFNSTAEIIYASADNVGVFQSTNAGLTWVPVAGGPTGVGRYDVVASQIVTADITRSVTPPTQQPANYTPDPALRAKQTVYIMAGGAGKDDGKIYKGEPPIGGPDKSPPTFRTLDNFPKSMGTGRSLWDQKGYNFYIGISKTRVHVAADTSFTPNLPAHDEIRDVLVVGILATYVSRDGGLLWSNGPNPHTDQHCITFNPTNTLTGPIEFLGGNDGGIYRDTVSYDGRPVPSPVPTPVPNPPTDPNTVGPFVSYTVNSANPSLGIGQFYTSAFHPTDTAQAIGGTQDNGNQLTYNGSPGWFGFFGGDGGACGINQFSPGLQYASDYTPKLIDPFADPVYQIVRTDNEWSNQFRIPLFVSSDVMPFILTGDVGKADPATPNSAGKATANVFFAATNYLYKFDEAVRRWTKFPFQFSQQGYVTAFNTSPSDPNYLYVGTLDGQVFYSSDAGKTFRNASNGLPGASVTHLEASASDPTKVFATLSGFGVPHVYVTNGIGGGWQSITGQGGPNFLPDTPTNAIVVKPGTNDLGLFAGTDVGVFYSADGGRNWADATGPLGLPNAQINNLTVEPSQAGGGYLYATTFGRGIWRLPLTATVPGPPTVTLTPTLQGYRGNKAKLKVTLTFSSGGTIVQKLTGNLSATGTITTNVLKGGVYDVYISISGFLNKRITNVQLAAGRSTTLTGAFLAGDVNGDNVVDATDLALVKANLNRYVTDATDVDGDGRVTSNDLTLVQGNQGKRGDN